MMMMMTDNIPTDILYTILLNGGFELLMVNRQLNNFKNDKNVIEKINELMYTDDERRIKYIEDTIINFIGASRKFAYKRHYLWCHFDDIGFNFTSTIEFIEDDLFWTCMRVEKKKFENLRNEMIEDEFEKQSQHIIKLEKRLGYSEESIDKSLSILRRSLKDKRIYFSVDGSFILCDREDLFRYYDVDTIAEEYEIWHELLIEAELYDLLS